MSTYLMYRLVFLMKMLFRRYETLLDNFGITNLVENSIATEKEKIHLVVNRKFFDVWNRDHDIWVASKLLALGLDVSEGTRDTEATWEDSERSVDDVRVVILLRLLEDGGIILTRLVSDSLNLFESVTTGYGLSLINTTTVLKDTLLLNIIIWFMV